MTDDSAFYTLREPRPAQDLIDAAAANLLRKARQRLAESQATPIADSTIFTGLVQVKRKP